MYNFNAADAVENIINDLKNYCSYMANPKCILGISGGKDSSVVATLAARAFGPENVIGVLMPNGEQTDIADSEKLVKFLGIRSITVNIKNIVDSLNLVISDAADDNINLAENSVTKTNDPAGIRLQVLMSISRRCGGLVLNTCNRSEDILGYSTLFGDSGGCYGPLCKYTVTEVLQIGDYLGVPYDLAHKAPSDGMCGSTDEENLSKILRIPNFTYARLDKLIRNLDHDFTATEVEAIKTHYRKNKFKIEIIQVKHPKVNLPDIFE